MRSWTLDVDDGLLLAGLNPAGVIMQVVEVLQTTHILYALGAAGRVEQHHLQSR
jgi:hypothetical protein